jgi:ribose transport system substrate-binding protein
MHRSLKYLTAAGIAITMLAPATMATAATKSKLQTKTIGISFPTYSQQAGPTLEINVAKEEAKKQGYKLLVDDPGKDNTKQLSTVETWINQGVGTIILQPLSTEPFEAVAAKARKKGIKWVVYANTMKNQDATLGFDHIQGGSQIATAAGKYITDKLGGKAEVAILTFTSGAWARNRQKGIEDALLKAAPGATIVARQDALSKTDGVNVAGPLFQAHPNLAVVLAVEEDATEGVYQWLSTNGHDKNDPKIFLAGIDGTKGVFEILGSGDSMYRASAGLDLVAVGKGFVSLPKDLWAGKKGDYSVPFELVTSTTPDLVKKYSAFYK